MDIYQNGGSIGLHFDETIYGFSSISNYVSGSMTWIKKKEVQYDNATGIRLCIAPYGTVTKADVIIKTVNPKLVYFEILSHFFSIQGNSCICRDSVIETENVGSNVSIGHHCYICKDVVIEDGVVIRNNVSIECPSHIGMYTVINSGVVIGADGYGYYKNMQGINKKVPHFGGVYISRDCEIGANTCIDRGTIDNTYIGNNVKIDNLCHIAHNVRIMDGAMVVAGSAKLEENAYIAPGTVVRNQLTVGENSLVGMGAVVTKDILKNSVYYMKCETISRKRTGMEL